MQLNKFEGSKKYVTVLADGKFHQNVPEGTEGAVIRTYEDKDGVEQKKTELVFDSVDGVITKLSFEDGDYGKSLNIELDGDGVISLATSSNFGEDFMKKLPNIDLSKSVNIAPFAFEDDKKKMRKGVSITQDGNKIESAYYNKDTKEAVGGIPEIKEDTTKWSSDDWKMHFMTVRKFLIGEVEKIITKAGFGF